MRRRSLRSPLNTLPPEKREVLHAWLRETLTLTQIVKRLKVELDVSTSEGALSAYQQRWGRELIALHRLTQSARCACGAQITVRLVPPGEMQIEVQQP